MTFTFDVIMCESCCVQLFFANLLPSSAVIFWHLTFWHMTYYLKHLSPPQGYFYSNVQKISLSSLQTKVTSKTIFVTAFQLDSWFGITKDYSEVLSLPGEELLELFICKYFSQKLPTKTSIRKIRIEIYPVLHTTINDILKMQ